MKILQFSFLFIPVILFFILFGGMLYLIYKSNNNEIELNANSWHYKLINWMWDIPFSNIKNICPYYWSIVGSILILPLYLIVLVFYKLVIAPISNFRNSKRNHETRAEYINRIVTEQEEREARLEARKKSIFYKLYQGASTFLEYSLIAIMISFALVSFYNIFRIGINTFPLAYVILFGSASVLIILLIIQRVFLENYNKYTNFIIFGMEFVWKYLKVVLLKIYHVFSWPFKKLKDYISYKYEKSCMAINWNTDQNL